MLPEDGEPPSAGGVDPLLPLALLESLKAHDRPSEVLEDEDLTTSLPRRLGLTGVVENQILRYEQARRRGRDVPAQEYQSLLRLVLRRPDADAILRESGSRAARREYERLPNAVMRLLRILPARLRFALARRAALRSLRRLAAPATVEAAGRPFVVRLSGNRGAAGPTCTILAGLIEETIALYTHTRAPVSHVRCIADSEKWCEWKLEG